MTRLRSLLGSLLLLGPIACGGKVVVDTTGAGGGTTTTGTTTSTITGTITTGDPFCGGEAGAQCPPDQFCHFAPDAFCGGGDQTGICQPKPQGCTADCPGVCGCDGKFYCNACSAQQAGVDVSPNSACAMQTDSYRAVSLFTNVPRFAILKASPSRNLCFRIVVEPGAMGISGDGWAASQVEVTSNAGDCDFPPGWPPPAMGLSVMSLDVKGVLSVPGSPVMCVVGIEGAAAFPTDQGWPPADEIFSASNLAIEGGCP